jgi:putative acetyltransferase
MYWQNSIADFMEIKHIQPADNSILAAIIRQCLLDFDAAKPGTVYFDTETDNLYEVFNRPRAEYFVLHIDGQIAGGAGIFPTPGLDADTCELVKLYINSANRGKGGGKKLMDTCMEAAKLHGYRKIYLETMPELNKAVPLYEKMGFKYVNQPLGQTMHYGCNIWMIKAL